MPRLRISTICLGLCFALSAATAQQPAELSKEELAGKLNNVDPQAWLADVLARLQDHAARRIAELLPWNWKRLQQPQQRVAA